MINIIFFPSLVVFFFMLYKLAKDDHVFLRRNVKLEHFFDIAFIVVLTWGIIGKIIVPNSMLSLSFFLCGGIIGLYLMSKYKKIPTGRVFDFFTLSFLVSIPLWYFFFGLFLKKTEQIIAFSLAIIYLLFAIIFGKVLFPKLMNRSLKEGMLSTIFLIIFSLISLAVSQFNILFTHKSFFNEENIILVLLLTLSVVLAVKLRK